MTGVHREDSVGDDVVVGARRVRAPVVAASTGAGPVRLVVSGPRGSAKSAVLDSIAEHVADAGRVVVRLTSADDPSAIPPDVVLLVDDVHTIDALTLDLLARRASDQSASLVVTIRPWSRSAAAVRIAQVLEQSRPALVLGQVSRADVLDHGVQALPPACVDWVLRATGGVSWLVAAALAAHDVRDCADDPLHLELDRLLAGTIAHRLAAVDDDVRVAVELACADLGRVSSQDALRHAYAEGLLLRDGRAVPAVRSAVDSGLSPQGLADRAVAAYAAGDLDAAAFLVDLASAQPGGGSAERLTAVAAATWSARGMLEIAARLHTATPGSTDAGAEVAAVGSGRVAESPTALAAAGATSTQRIAADLLREGLRSSIAGERADAAVASLARASQLHTASRSTDPLPELPAVIAAAAAQSHGDVAAARAAIDAALAGRQGGDGSAPRLLLWRAWLAMHQVRSREARESLAAAVLAAPAGFTPRDEMLAHAVRLGLARRHGDAASLAAAWEEASARLAAVDVDLYVLQPLTEFIASAAKLRHGDATGEALRQGLDILHRLGDPPLWSSPLRWAAVQRAILLNEPESLAPHAHALFAASGRSEVAATMASAGRLWTAVLGGTVDPDDVEAAAVALSRIGLTWDGARLTGFAAKVTGDRRIAARLLARARDIHPPDAARPATHPIPDSRPASDTPSFSGLSPREIDVARLVVEGKTYAEIGAAIFISPRTAEHHIASIRRRLGATSRSDLIAKLTAALAAHAADAKAVV